MTILLNPSSVIPCYSNETKKTRGLLFSSKVKYNSLLEIIFGRNKETLFYLMRTRINERKLSRLVFTLSKYSGLLGRGLCYYESFVHTDEVTRKHRSQHLRRIGNVAGEDRLQSPANECKQRPVPVSYTHLDVYKRQINVTVYKYV